MYAALVGGFIVLLLTRDSVFSVWSVRASTRLHNALFSRVLSAPMLFFLRTPVGDVLNAFARDQVCARALFFFRRCVRRVCVGAHVAGRCSCRAAPRCVWRRPNPNTHTQHTHTHNTHTQQRRLKNKQDTLDETLPDTVHMTTIYLMILLTSLGIVTVSINYYAVMAAALFASFAMMQTLYLPAATTLKRWAGETASAVFVHVDESLQGMDVIRAFGAVDYFIQENVARLNTHHLALFNTEQTHLWLAFWCDFFGAVLVVATCLFSVALSDTLGGANVGLAISNSIQVRF